MIDLHIQIRLIVFSFIFGFLASYILEIFNKYTEKLKDALKLILSFVLILFISFIYFLGIIKIGFAIFHVYSILSIILGFILYDILIKVIFK